MAQLNESFQLILETAEALIREKGCRQTTLQDIISRTGLSKGAIYHYVTGKDELLGRLLQSRVEQTNAKFYEVVDHPDTKGLEEPLQLIAERVFGAVQHDDVTNQIFLYLLSRMDDRKVSDIMKGIYQYTLDTCSKWIEAGQRAGVIPAAADRMQLAEGMMMFMYGLRVQNTILQDGSRMNAHEVTQFMFRVLR
ncbi:TetR/AcrR family transcriptional regulator [Paenibacillus allorhizosphaerae]|uniref:HTH tetR-type domain-containing protein n=1 Tax=Paenibacillus allorhizosphaerae TaxID=2849866 RepID=A0ABN7TVJ5_9BACL|nr:TetR/AcrR family transcriptional regulator [Paenibacillus allorhizosphaerae]CAG7653883.1 hypothetical protein PAECIP111802_05610 [Paenibacillus allorhizosphaerae]